MARFEPANVVKSLINPHRWTFMYLENGALKNHEKMFQNNFISREVAQTTMYAFVDEKNLGINVS
jgi:hypothetical protein